MVEWRVAWIGGVALGALLGGRVLRVYLERWAGAAGRRGRPLQQSAAAALARCAPGTIGALALARILPQLPWPAPLAPGVAAVARVLDVLAVGWVAWAMVAVVVRWLELTAQRSRSRLDEMLVPIVGHSLRATVLVLVMVQVAQTLSDKPVTSILAGLGIGGLAVALAAQDSLRNFFGSIVLLADKPFGLGDRIAAGDLDGVVESVGLRSTRLRTLDGELVTIPNGDLAGRAIRNYGRRTFIRSQSVIGITYDTPPQRVERAMEILRELLDRHEGFNAERPPRVHFREYGPYSLNLQVVYWYHPADWWAYLDHHSRLNLEILRRFAAEGIQFAFPTQTVHIAGGAGALRPSEEDRT
ncbi:MAG: mechanosensitive ion channel family protein [Kiritimatiellae bacterium]|nr:mechanosensitive ion channel family protein [Kiritimatiellia bacterium]